MKPPKRLYRCRNSIYADATDNKCDMLGTEFQCSGCTGEDTYVLQPRKPKRRKP